ncbi:MAG TPA: CRISPR system precrRNA processing endoribonuclease RAMP protein Cas6 [Candidatus Angelobacter sp.]|nr:CRISPR system precrRNA processing endoribonuclease RAMP protein Cas6 [Candidatus Angelobacter sp.]
MVTLPQHQPTITLLSRAFPVGVFRFTLVPRETLFVPAINKANMLRGAFGNAFRRLCCVPQCANAHACPLASSCAYKAIFEPSPPPDADRLSKNQDVPRPFVFRAPLNDKTKFEPGEEFEFGLILIGCALDHLPYFVLSFRELAAQGLGLNRAKCELNRVEEDALRPSVPSGAKIFDAADQVFHGPQGLNVEKWINERIISFPEPLKTIRIQFLSPTWIKSENQVIRKPDFFPILKRLRDRINALSTFFGSGPLNVDFAGLGKHAEHVRTVSCSIRWEDRFRTSSKTLQRHELSGFVGEAVYTGELGEFLPWLTLGELVHVGKHTAWGMGHIRSA